MIQRIRVAGLLVLTTAWQRPVSDNLVGGVDPIVPGRLIQFGGHFLF